MNKNEIITKLSRIVNANKSSCVLEIRVNNWQNYGKDRTYFSIVETHPASKHVKERKYGYIDNITGEYVGSVNDFEFDFHGAQLPEETTEETTEDTDVTPMTDRRFNVECMRDYTIDGIRHCDIGNYIGDYIHAGTASEAIDFAFDWLIDHCDLRAERDGDRVIVRDFFGDIVEEYYGFIASVR